MSEKNKALVRRGVEAYNEHDLDAIPDMFTADFVYHGPQGDRGKRAYLQNLERSRFAAFPNVHASIEDIFAEEDRVAVRYTFGGTHQETGKRVTWRTIAIWRFAGGKFAEGWVGTEDPMQQIQS